MTTDRDVLLDIATAASKRRKEAPFPRPLTERQFQRQVEELLTRFNWRWDHHPDSRRMHGTPGRPDILAVRCGRLLAIELKCVTGHVSVAQEDWHDELRVCPGVEVYIWRPADLDAIARALR